MACWSKGSFIAPATVQLLTAGVFLARVFDPVEGTGLAFGRCGDLVRAGQACIAALTQFLHLPVLGRGGFLMGPNPLIGQGLQSDTHFERVDHRFFQDFGAASSAFSYLPILT